MSAPQIGSIRSESSLRSTPQYSFPVLRFFELFLPTLPGSQWSKLDRKKSSPPKKRTHKHEDAIGSFLLALGHLVAAFSSSAALEYSLWRRAVQSCHQS